MTRNTLLVASSVLLLSFAAARAGFAQCEPLQTAKLTAVDGALEDRLGEAVSLLGDMAAVGVPLDNAPAANSGSVVVFQWTGDSWTAGQKVAASHGASDDHFGAAVCLFQDLLLVGAPLLDDGVLENSGAMYVFRWDGTSFVEEQKVLPSDARADQGFGNSIRASGDVILVGAPGDDDHGVVAGAAYVFRLAGKTLIEEQKLEASDSAPFDGLGGSVAVSGKVALLGSASHGGRGAIYFFRHDGSRWQLEQKVGTGSDGADFGSSLDLDGDLALAGAPGSMEDGIERAGAAFLYRWDGTAWRPEQKLRQQDPEVYDNFGWAVAVRGDAAYVGMPIDDVPAYAAGSVHVFRHQGSDWARTAILRASDGVGEERFGSRISASGERVLIGAPMAAAPKHWSGAAYVFDRPQASLANFGAGWPGTLGIPTLTASSDPRLCSDLVLELENSLGTPTLAVMFVGAATGQFPTPWDGILLVQAIAYLQLVLPDVSLGGGSLPVSIPCDSAFCGVVAYLQALELDSGASSGVSFSPGLALHLGN